MVGTLLPRAAVADRVAKGPETRRVVEVFVAAPSDAAAEKTMVLSVIGELNDVWSKYTGVLLGSLTWELSVTPGMGADAQDVVNEQIGDSYELFVGIMGDRIGSPTSRARSGTIEEYERAVGRSRSSNGCPEIFFYFREPGPDRGAIVSEVGEFVERVSKDGVLYKRFSDVAALERIARLHLSLFVQRKARSRRAPQRPNAREEAATLELPGTRRAAILTAEAHSEIVNVTASASRISELMGSVNQKTSDTTARLRALKRPGFRRPPGGAMGVASRFAPSLERFAEELEETGGLMLRSYCNSVESIGESVAILAPLSWIPASLRVAIAGISSSIEKHVKQFEDLSLQLAGIQKSLDSWMGISKELDSARNSANNAIAAVRLALASTANEAAGVLESLRDFAAE